MKTPLVNFTIPRELLAKADGIAKRQFRSRSEFFREAIRKLIEQSDRRERDFELIRKSASDINLSEDEAIKLVDKVRDSLPINKRR